MHPDFSGKTLLITGGTGLWQRRRRPPSGDRHRRNRIFSRDEKSRTTCAISAESATPPPGESSGFTWATCGSRVPFGPPWRGADYVIHAAALKQVPSCEFFPWRPSEPTYWAQNMCWRPPQPPG